MSLARKRNCQAGRASSGARSNSNFTVTLLLPCGASGNSKTPDFTRSGDNVTAHEVSFLSSSALASSAAGTLLVKVVARSSTACFSASGDSARKSRNFATFNFVPPFVPLSGEGANSTCTAVTRD